jgi:hypothetical protein
MSADSSKFVVSMSSQLTPLGEALASAASVLHKKFVKIITMQDFEDQSSIGDGQKTFRSLAREGYGSPCASRIRRPCRDCAPRAAKPLKSS